MMILPIVLSISAQMHSINRYVEYFCADSEKIYSTFESSLYNGYDVWITGEFKSATEIKVKLDSVGSLSLFKARFTSEIDLIENVISFVLTEDVKYVHFTVKGKDYPLQPPYILSLKINGKEMCKNTSRLYFERSTSIIKLWPKAPDKFCGRRRINDESFPLIVSGSSTNPGHWPWHAAINKIIKGVQSYICGGTLISQYLVLTAAHCATTQGVRLNPEILGVVLGKHRLNGIESTNQDREVVPLLYHRLRDRLPICYSPHIVFEVIIHDNFDRRSLNNDIALLKLSAEALFNNFVQPACIWVDDIYDELPSLEITGTIIGWGIDQSDTLSKNLRSAIIPIVSDVTCIRYEPVFYTNVLNGRKFCAGNSNGTSACNGDSGGGFFVFVEDDKNYNVLKERPGAWYIKGIVSVTLVRKDADICDPNAYTVFIDIAQYRDWILTHMK